MSKLAFVFPGQGAQYVGMGKDFYEKFSSCRDVYDMASKVTGLDIPKLCFEENTDINVTEYTQIAMLATEAAILRVLKENGIYSEVNAGLSLGEYGALIASEVMSEEDAFRVVRKRGILMQEAVPVGGAMCAVMGMDGDKIAEVCESVPGIVSVANYNCPGQIVITGEEKAVAEACDRLKEAGARRCIPLKVSGPFHSIMLKEAGEKLGEVLEQVNIKDIKIPYITNVTADYVTEPGVVKELLEQQVYSSVKWQQSVEKMIEDGKKYVFDDIRFMHNPREAPEDSGGLDPGAASAVFEGAPLLPREAESVFHFVKGDVDVDEVRDVPRGGRDFLIPLDLVLVDDVVGICKGRGLEIAVGIDGNDVPEGGARSVGQGQDVIGTAGQVVIEFGIKAMGRGSEDPFPEPGFVDALAVVVAEGRDPGEAVDFSELVHHRDERADRAFVADHDVVPRGDDDVGIRGSKKRGKVILLTGYVDTKAPMQVRNLEDVHGVFRREQGEFLDVIFRGEGGLAAGRKKQGQQKEGGGLFLHFFFPFPSFSLFFGLSFHFSKMRT